MPKNIRYSHSAIWVYSQITTKDGQKLKGYQVHNLYFIDHDRDRSHLVSDFPADFYTPAKALRSGVIVPTPAVQAALIKVINEGGMNKVHNPNYSLLSNPFNQQFQNCNEFILDLMMHVLYPGSGQKQLKANLKAYFEPVEIKIGFFKSVFGPMLREDVSLRDHPGTIHTATFGSIAEFMQKYDLAAEIYHFE